MVDRIIIPARKGSKGFTGKNQILFGLTAKTIPADLRNKVIVSTDDEVVQWLAGKWCFRVDQRPPELAVDEASIRDVLADLAERERLRPDEIVLVLYLTYPERTWAIIADALAAFARSDADSLLCAIDAKTHPYLCVYPDGKQVVQHDLCRRQEYPEVLELSHLVCCVRAGRIGQLNRNCYNDNTMYFKTDRRLDIDTREDYDNFVEKLAMREGY